jgi:NADH-quinone oxidoreductase subunit G/NADP-reducing hydrogenase subunit HndD
MMLGALVKSYYAEKIGAKPEDMFVVSVMPCTAKKTEIAREEMKNNGLRNVDAVLTTRELANMIRQAGIDFMALEDAQFDNPLGMSTGAADIFGLTGGVMEAALRTVYELVTGRELPFEDLHVKPIVGLDQVKTAEITIKDPVDAYSFLDGVTLKVAVTSGLKGARILMDQLDKGESPYHFIEVMGCPGGCITGGGQPRSADPEVRLKRLQGLYREDEGKQLRKSHENPYITAIYEEYLEYPSSHRSHELLHTHYVKRGKYNELGGESFAIGSKQAREQEVKPEGADVVKTAAERVVNRKNRDEAADIRMLALETENMRLKNELNDAMETVQIYKQIVSEKAFLEKKRQMV